MNNEKISGFIYTVEGKQQIIGNKVTKSYLLSKLEIGDRFLQNITLPEQLSIFINAGQEITIWLTGKKNKSIVAIERTDGKLFVVNHKKPGKLSLVIGLALIPLSGLGLLVLLGRYLLNRHYNIIQEIVSQYPSYENLNV